VAFALAAALLLSLVALFGYLRLEAGLDDDLNLELRQRAQDLQAPVRRPGASLTDLGGRGFIERGESFAEVLTPSGHVVDATPTLHDRPLLSPAQAAAAAVGTTTIDRSQAPGLNEPARLLATPLTRSGDQLVLVVGDTRENGLETLRRVRNQLFLGIPILVVLTFCGAYLVAGAALRPVELMRRRASELTGEGLALRLPIPRTYDEISRLGETLNDLLMRVQNARDRERSFVAHASHELRTPLALLRTELEIALRRPRSATELCTSIESATTEVDRLQRLSEDLLLLALSGESGLGVQLEEVPVADMYDIVTSRFEGSFDDVRREITREHTDEIVSADRHLLQQALTNLVANALEHGSGPVSLTVRRSERVLELVVTDRGEPVDPELFGKATERFVRSPTSPGAGLGLSIVRVIAEAHGGTSGIRQLDGATEAWLSIPAHQGAPKGRTYPAGVP
jgi:signal transduction histidine kinase